MPAILGFEHPAPGKALRFESPLPPDMMATFDRFTALITQ